MTTTLGAGLVAFRDVALCDRRSHEVAIVTDGRTAYAYPIDSRSPVYEDTAVARVGVTLTAACPLAGGSASYGDSDPDQCDGTLTWRLDADHGWGADGDALALLARFGQVVES